MVTFCQIDIFVLKCSANEKRQGAKLDKSERRANT